MTDAPYNRAVSALEQVLKACGGQPVAIKTSHFNDADREFLKQVGIKPERIEQ